MATPEISGSVTKARAERSGRRRLDLEDRARVGADARCGHDEGTGADGAGYDVGTCSTNCVERRAFAFAVSCARGRRRTRDAAHEVEASCTASVERVFGHRAGGMPFGGWSFQDRPAALPDELHSPWAVGRVELPTCRLTSDALPERDPGRTVQAPSGCSRPAGARRLFLEEEPRPNGVRTGGFEPTTSRTTTGRADHYATFAMSLARRDGTRRAKRHCAYGYCQRRRIDAVPHASHGAGYGH